MASGRRYFFLLPQVDRPVGGINVLLQAADRLAEEGYDTRLLHATPGFRYEFHDCARPVFYNPALKEALVTSIAGRGINRKRIEAEYLVARLGLRRDARQAERAQPGAGDILVVPEIIYPDVVDLFPGTRVVVAVQVIHGMARAFERDLKKTGPGQATALSRCQAILATSETCQAIVRTVSGQEPILVPLHVGFEGLHYAETKKRQVAYMPRKRPVDARFVTAVLKRAPELEGYDFVPIHGMKPPEVVEVLRESLIFISLARNEGFGLPAAEAMLAGCVTVGYAGVGGEEFMTPDTCFEVPDGDMIRLIDAVKRVAVAYDADPAPLDAMRRRASEVITRRYSLDGFEQGLAAAWERIEAGLS
jgi:glycosyltransferase involved in cell wall biosynthesis